MKSKDAILFRIDTELKEKVKAYIEKEKKYENVSVMIRSLLRREIGETKE